MRRFLTETCADIKRWLPEPKWTPGWRSETSSEYANVERGTRGPWGPDAVASVYTAAALYLEAVLQCARAISACLTVDSTQYVPSCLNRAAMEAGSQAFWLLEPGIGARRRVTRFMLLRASGAWQQAEQLKRTNPSAVGSFGETPDRVAELTSHYGLAVEFRPYKGRFGGEWWCETEKLPSPTERNRVLEEGMFTAGAYSIYSSALHAQWHSVVGNWEEVELEDGTKAIVSRPDRLAVWSTVLLAPAPALAVATRVFPILGYHARRREVRDWVDRALALMRQMDLPPAWWAT